MDTKKNLSWSDRRVVGTFQLHTLNNDYRVEVRHGITDEGKDSFVGRLIVDGRYTAFPAFQAHTIDALEYWTISYDGGAGSFSWDFQRTNAKKDEHGKVIVEGTRLDRRTYTAKLDMPDGDQTVRVSLIWKEGEDGFTGSVSADYRSEGGVGVKKAPRIDASAF